MTSLVRVDVGQLVAELQQTLRQYATWQDLVIDATGETIIEFLATVAVYAIFANERAFQEVFYDTAKLQSSVLGIARNQGVRIARKLPASCTALITKPADGLTYSIPAYSAFIAAGGVALYNRTAIVFDAVTVSQTATLYVGTIKALNVQGTGNDFQTFVSSESGFVIADVDVLVNIQGVDIPVVTDGLWHYAATPINGVVTTTPAVQDATTKNGNLELRFGSANYGTLPAVGQAVTISYAVTTGAAGNNVAFSGTQLYYDTYSTIVASSALSGGADERNPFDYQRIGPSSFSSFMGAVTAPEYNALAVSYPGVIDARIDGQRIVAPTTPQFMNTLRGCLLTTSAWTSTQWNDFVAWFNKRSMSYMNVYRSDPVPAPYNIDITVYCDSTVPDLSTVQNNVSQALATQLAPQYGWIKRTVYRSDIEGIAKGTSGSILTVQRRQPTYDFVTSNVLFNLALVENAAGSGSSVAGATATYGITAISTAASGESVPTTIDIVTSGGTSVSGSWDPVDGIATFNVYRQVNGVLYLLTSLPGTATGFTDTFTSNLGIQQAPIIDGFPLLYPSLVSINVVAKYSTDRGTGQVGV